MSWIQCYRARGKWKEVEGVREELGGVRKQVGGARKAGRRQESGGTRGAMGEGAGTTVIPGNRIEEFPPFERQR